MNNKVRNSIRDVVYKALQVVYTVKEPYTDKQIIFADKIVIDTEKVVSQYLKERKV